VTFGEPGLLWALLVLPFLAALIIYNDRRRHQRLEQLVAARLLPELTDPVAQSRKLIKRLLFLGALVALVLALARPQSQPVGASKTRRARYSGRHEG
jgi:hypothetical protein